MRVTRHRPQSQSLVTAIIVVPDKSNAIPPDDNGNAPPARPETPVEAVTDASVASCTPPTPTTDDEGGGDSDDDGGEQGENCEEQTGDADAQLCDQMDELEGEEMDDMLDRHGIGDYDFNYQHWGDEVEDEGTSSEAEAAHSFCALWENNPDELGASLADSYPSGDDDDDDDGLNCALAAEDELVAEAVAAAVEQHDAHGDSELQDVLARHGMLSNAAAAAADEFDALVAQDQQQVQQAGDDAEGEAEDHDYLQAVCDWCQQQRGW